MQLSHLTIVALLAQNPETRIYLDLYCLTFTQLNKLIYILQKTEREEIFKVYKSVSSQMDQLLCCYV
jgi:hypothetical protein